MSEKINLIVWPWFAFHVVKDDPDKEEVEVVVYWDLGGVRENSEFKENSEE